jgi:catechol 2,3-dioxygenase-like lactoylglutathione lyase family enzyme
MSIELNHTIVHVKDRWVASREVGHVLGLPEATSYGPFAELALDNGVSLDFMDSAAEIHAQHYAFLVGEDDFDAILGRLRDDGREWWADPFKRQVHTINHGDGGRGLYWEGPDGHWLEIITRPYGSGG